MADAMARIGGAEEGGRNVLAVRGLTVSYAGRRVLDGVSLDVASGAIVGLAGESGSGKSTLVAAVLGALGPQGRVEAGGISFRGAPVEALDRRRRLSAFGGRVALVQQNPAWALSPIRTLEAQFAETIRARCRREGVAQPDSAALRAEAIGQLEALDLDDVSGLLRRRAFELSGGQCQRVALALAMAQRPALLLADEPTSALDTVSQLQVVRELLKLRGATRAAGEGGGLGMLVISHNLGVLRRLADEICVLCDGCIVERGPAERICTAPEHPCTRTLVEAVPRLERDGADAASSEADAAVETAGMAGTAGTRRAQDGGANGRPDACDGAAPSARDAAGTRRAQDGGAL